MLLHKQDIERQFGGLQLLTNEGTRFYQVLLFPPYTVAAREGMWIGNDGRAFKIFLFFIFNGIEADDLAVLLSLAQPPSFRVLLNTMGLKFD